MISWIDVVSVRANGKGRAIDGDPSKSATRIVVAISGHE